VPSVAVTIVQIQHLAFPELMIKIIRCQGIVLFFYTVEWCSFLLYHSNSNITLTELNLHQNKFIAVLTYLLYLNGENTWHNKILIMCR
jgi:hypothetical protein